MAQYILDSEIKADEKVQNDFYQMINEELALTEEEFENRWMVIGTSNKLSLPYTPKGRKKAGKKENGRREIFAACGA